MKRLSIVGVASLVAVLFSGCGSISQRRDSDYQANQLFQQHRQQTDQTIKQIERRVSQIPDPN